MKLYTAFAGIRYIASGSLHEIVKQAKPVFDSDPWIQVLVFNDETSQQLAIDWSGTVDDVLWRLDNIVLRTTQARAPLTSKLGLVNRQAALLPRHWEWLDTQPGGASAALRRLVEAARIANREKDRQRQAQESLYRFIVAMAGNLPGFEEAARALFAGRRDDFMNHIKDWPNDVVHHIEKLSPAAF